MKLPVIALIFCLIASDSIVAQEMTTPSVCPDFSGRYDYPGPGTELCSHTSRFGFDGLALPIISGKSGGYISMKKPGILEFRQNGCSSLSISAVIQIFNFAAVDESGERFPYNDPRGWLDRSWSGTFNLLPPRKREKRFPPTVEWTETSLKFRSRYVAEGFGKGWGYNALVFTLEWKDDATLLYSFRDEKGRRGKRFMDIQCELKRVTADVPP